MNELFAKAPIKKFYFKLALPIVLGNDYNDDLQPS